MKTLIFYIVAVTTIVANPTLQDFTTANQWFSGSFYKKISKNQNNFLASPLSAETILALTQSGCKGETAEEIRSALNFTNDPSVIESNFGNLLPSFSESRFYTFRTANKLYIKKGFNVKDDFKRVVREVYKADSETIEFSPKNKAAKIINSWVEKETDNKINNLVDASNINNRTRMIAVNALYFKANWSKPFPIAYTKKLNFHISPSQAKKVDMMLLHEETLNYYESSNLDARFLELPFKGQDAQMIIALPNKIDGLSDLENQIKKVLRVNKFSRRSVNVGLPRFRIETTLNLKKIFKQMGINRVFDEHNADLSGIAGEKGDLVLDKISQKTFIDVSEEGVEAAAATYVLIAIPMSAPLEEPISFKVDRPFIFYIKIKGLIVFVGKVVNPKT